MKKLITICFVLFCLCGIKVFSQDSENNLQHEREENETKFYGRVTNKERDEIVEIINNLKSLYEKELQPILETKASTVDTALKKTSEYESRKMWVYALSEYYYASNSAKNIQTETQKLVDSYTAERNEIISKIAGITEWHIKQNKTPYQQIELEISKESVHSSNEKYSEIMSAIDMGNPWLGTFDDFSKYDAWKELLKDTEKYFSEYPPISISVGKLEKGSTDMKTRTYIYTTNLTAKTTSFFDDFFRKEVKALSTVRNDSWTEVPKNWPVAPLISVGDKSDTTELFGKIYKKRSNMLINGIPYVEIYADFQNKVKTQQESIRLTEQMAYSYGGAYGMGMQDAVKQSREALNRDIAKMQKLGADKVISLDMMLAWSVGLGDSQTMYDIKLNLIDENGKIIAKGDKKLVGSDGAYEFKGISSAISKLIEEDKVKIVVDSVYLNYG